MWDKLWLKNQSWFLELSNLWDIKISNEQILEKYNQILLEIKNCFFEAQTIPELFKAFYIKLYEIIEKYSFQNHSVLPDFTTDILVYDNENSILEESEKLLVRELLLKFAQWWKIKKNVPDTKNYLWKKIQIINWLKIWLRANFWKLSLHNEVKQLFEDILLAFQARYEIITETETIRLNTEKAMKAAEQLIYTPEGTLSNKMFFIDLHSLIEEWKEFQICRIHLDGCNLKSKYNTEEREKIIEEVSNIITKTIQISDNKWIIKAYKTNDWWEITIIQLWVLRRNVLLDIYTLKDFIDNNIINYINLNWSIDVERSEIINWKWKWYFEIIDTLDKKIK